MNKLASADVLLEEGGTVPGIGTGGPEATPLVLFCFAVWTAACVAIGWVVAS